MKNYLAIGTLAVCLFSVGVANAEEPVFRTENQSQATCTTRSRGRRYTVTSSSQAVAQQSVLRACVRGGGRDLQCRRNLACQIDDGGYPAPQPWPPRQDTYYNWGQGSNGYGYCFLYAWDGSPADQGYPQANQYCERVRPSHFAWGQGQNGLAHCYQVTPYNAVMNEGRAVDPSYCQYQQ